MRTDGFATPAIGLAALAFAASLVLSRLVLGYARAHALFDHPNERSSHTHPMPRGGGLAVVIVVLAGMAVLWAAGALPARMAVAFTGGGGLVAWVGWVDDHHSLRASTRLLAHLAAAVWLVWWLGGMPILATGAERLHLGLAGGALAVLGTMWAINFYNFMDGIDGLATGEAVFVGLAGAVLLGPDHATVAAVSLLVAAAAAGFLPFNWPPARIFMGDVCSGFLGFLFAGLALASENSGAVPALAWLILLGVFFLDATVTLVRRMFRGERWYASHRSHGYQRAVQAGWSHHGVVTAVLLVNVILAGLAWLGASESRLLPVALALAGCVLGSAYLLVERRRPMGTHEDTPLVKETSDSTP